ncbi:hypothetical protein MNBD_GAMMA12-484 [hydrothermal vent metagenome]|uniref:Uncharacterized protein n=1 Tax=hydrothermal vent metagenome TaxID=652676 RepID=A0A3B0YYS7_9ZZZZ
MSGLLMISVGLMVLVVWALSVSFILGSSDFESTVARYCQALIFPVVIIGTIWSTIFISGRLYATILVWLNIEPTTVGIIILLALLVLLICLPLFIGSIYFFHLSLSKLDRYLDRDL